MQYWGGPVEKRYPLLSMYKRLSRYILSYWYLALGSLILVFANSLMAPITGEMMRKVFYAIEELDKGGLFYYSLIVIVVFLGASILRSAKTYVVNLFSAKSSLDLERDLYRHITSLPMDYFQKNHSGDMIARLTNDLGSVRGIIGNQVISLLQFPIDAIAVTIYGFLVNWQITVATLVFAPLPLALNVFLGKKIREASKEVHDIWSKLYSLTNDVVKGTNVVKAYSIRDLLLRKVQKRYDQQVEVGLKRTKLQLILGFGVSLVANCSLLIPALVGAHLILKGVLRLGDVIAFLSIVPGITEPFFRMPNIVYGFQQGAAATERVLEVLDTEPEKYGDKTLPEELSIEIQNASFCYETTKALDSVRLQIKHGTHVGVVGPSGCGKSTILKMILGFFKPQDGEILINGQDMFSYNLNEWRNLIAYVPQEPYLFSGTVLENILVAKPDATEEEWKWAAKVALVEDFISELPSGYDTVVGQNGMNISGGQRQRIGIARALLKGAPILLLDEATSSLDNDTEFKLYQGLEQYTKVETIVAVAHRLTKLQKADTIYVLDRGKVVAQGDHKYLLENCGMYAQLYHGQEGEVAS